MRDYTGIVCANNEEADYIISMLPRYGLSEKSIESIETHGGYYVVNIKADKKIVGALARAKNHRFDALKIGMARKQAIRVAEDLGYPIDTIRRIQIAQSEDEINRILCSTRKNQRR